MLATVSAAMPGPLSETVIAARCAAVLTSIAMTGAMPASSQQSMPLSTHSFSTTSGHSGTAWPIWAVSSRCPTKSSSRDVRKTIRSRRGGFGGRLVARREPSLRTVLSNAPLDMLFWAIVVLRRLTGPEIGRG